MVVRNVSTRFAVQGEAEYQAKVSAINRELKVFQTALKAADSDIKANGASIESLTAKSATLDEAYQAQTNALKTFKEGLENAKKAADEHRQKMEDLGSELKNNKSVLEDMGSKTMESGEKWAKYSTQVEGSRKKLEMLKKSSEDTTEEQAKLQQKIDTAKQAMEKLETSTDGAAKTAGKLILKNQELNSDLTMSEKCYDAAQRGVENWQIKINNSTTGMNKLKGEINENNKSLADLKNGTSEAADGAEELADKTVDSAKAVSDLNAALAAGGLIAMLKQAAGALMDCARASIEYESAITGVAKTTDLTDSELNAMRESLQRLSTQIPVTANELAGITEAAGQLGIKKESLIDFATVMANLGVATNMSANDAATALAKFANVVGTSANDYDRLGSVIVALGNNFATTESDIVRMATRLASSGSIIGLTEAEIMAVSAALSSVGIEAEAGGSAISKILKQFETMVATGSSGLQDFAQVAGMSSNEFSQAWGENAMGALSKFLSGLKNIDESGGSAVATLSDLGVTEIRTSNAVLALANAGDLLTEAIGLSNNAWEENTALTKEAELRYGTTESKLQMLGNAATNAKTAFGDGLTPAIRWFADVGTDALNFLGDFITKNDEVVPLVTAAGIGLAALAVAIVGYNVAVNIAIPATLNFTAALASNPVGLVLVALAGAAALITGFAIALNNDATPSVKDLTTAAQEFKDTIASSEDAYKNTETSIAGAISAAEPYIEHLKNIEGESLAAGKATDEYAITVDRIKALLPDVNIELDAQTGLIKGGTAAITEQAESWKELALQEALATKYSDQLEAWANATVEVASNQVDLNAAIAEGNNLKQQQEDAIKGLASAQQRQLDIAENTNLTESERLDLIAGLNSKVNEYGDIIRDTSVALTENEQKQKTLNDAISSGEKTIEEHEGAVNHAKDVLNDYAEQQSEAKEAIEGNTKTVEKASRTIEDYAAAWGTTVGEISEYLEKNNADLEDWEAAQIKATEKVADEWNVSAESIQQSLAANGISLKEWESAAEDMTKRQGEMLEDYTESATDMFSRISNESGTSLDKMIENLTYNAEAVANWADNIAKLAEMGIDQGLLQTLIDAGPESAAAVQEIVNGSGEKIMELSDKFAEGGDAALKAYGKVLEVDPDNNAAIEFLQGIAASVENDTSVSNAMSGAGEDFKGALEKSIDPVDAQRFTGKLMEGAADEIAKKSPELVGTAEKAGTDVKNTFEESATDTVKGFSAEFDKITGRTKTTLNALRETVSAGTAELPFSMHMVGAGMVDGLIYGMNSRSSALYSTIASIVNNAVASAKKAAAVNSPSKKTMVIGDGMVEGVIVSAEAKKEKLKNTMQGIIDASINLDTTEATNKLKSLDLSVPVVSDMQYSHAGAQTSGDMNFNFHIDKAVMDNDNDIKTTAKRLATEFFQEVKKVQRGAAKI